MDNFILIIGPSGTGKSKTVDSLQLSDHFIVKHLDAVICKDNNKTSISTYYTELGTKEAFFNKTKESIDKLKNEFPDKTIILDVGAGSIDYSRCITYYESFKKVYLFADFEVLYSRLIKRNPKDKRSLTQYLDSEYSAHRMVLYNSCKDKIDNSNLTIVETAKKLQDIVINAIS